MTDFEQLIRRLVAEGVEFIVVGGFAGAIHGATRSTQDLDIVYRQTSENVQRIVRAISPLSPYPRGAAAGLPFRFDQQTIEFGSSFALSTTLGFIDLLGDITGGGGYGQLLPFTIKVTLFGEECRCLDLPKLIQVKRAAGRAKDFDALAELEAIAEERERT